MVPLSILDLSPIVQGGTAAEALKAKADTVEAAPEPAPAPALRRSSAMPKYMDPKVGSWTLGDFGRRGDVASIDALFKEGCLLYTSRCV